MKKIHKCDACDAARFEVGVDFCDKHAPKKSTATGSQCEKRAYSTMPLECANPKHPGLIWCLKCVNESANKSHAAQIKAEKEGLCWCYECNPALHSQRMVVCPVCGNKRCPLATDHINACSGSNEPGQEGSDFHTEYKRRLPMPGEVRPQDG